MEQRKLAAAAKKETATSKGKIGKKAKKGIDASHLLGDIKIPLKDGVEG